MTFSATKYEDECKSDEQCTPLLGDKGKCINRTCKCEIIHHHKDDRCYEKTPLNAPCERSSECFVTTEPDTVECRNSECKCKVETTPDVEAQACIKPRPTKSKFFHASAKKCLVSVSCKVNLMLCDVMLKHERNTSWTVAQNKLFVFRTTLIVSKEKNLMLTHHAKTVVM